MIRKPVKLANALMKISGPYKRFTSCGRLDAFFIIPALSGNTIGSLFSTHPPVVKRIQNLMEMEDSMSEQLMLSRYIKDIIIGIYSISYG